MFINISKPVWYWVTQCSLIRAKLYVLPSILKDESPDLIIPFVDFARASAGLQCGESSPCSAQPRSQPIPAMAQPPWLKVFSLWWFLWLQQMTLVNHFPRSDKGPAQRGADSESRAALCPVSLAISHLPLLGVVALGLPRVQQGLDFAAGCARSPSGSGAALGFQFC